MSTTALPHATAASPSRRPLYLLLLTFILPFAAAAIVLKTGWYGSIGTTNHGTLINHSLTLSQILESETSDQGAINEKTWKLLFIMPSACDAICENSLYLIKQIETAMGPDKLRVDTLVVQPRFRDALNQRMQAALPELPAPTESKHLYLVDPQGRVFMHYPVLAERHAAILHARDIVKDLKHALKLSKIG